MKKQYENPDVTRLTLETSDAFTISGAGETDADGFYPGHR